MTTQTIKTFRDPDAWKASHKLVLNTYELTKELPKYETFGLFMQMRRAAVSITSNLAEGFARETYKEKIRFYYISRGSAVELENQLQIAKDVAYISEVQYLETLNHLQKSLALINGLIKKSKTYV